jgi:hypothetical protein
LAKILAKNEDFCRNVKMWAFLKMTMVERPRDLRKMEKTEEVVTMTITYRRRPRGSQAKMTATMRLKVRRSRRKLRVEQDSDASYFTVVREKAMAYL